MHLAKLHEFANLLSRATCGHRVARGSVDCETIKVGSAIRVRCVRKEHLLAVDLVPADGFLAFPRTQPIDELLAVLLPHQRMHGGVYECDAILIEHGLVPLNHTPEVAFAFETGPRGPIGP